MSPGMTDEDTPEETTEEGEPELVPGSIAVEATGDYTVEVSLEEPFPSALSMIAYSAFSVVPEGIVGDIEGYDGEMEVSEFATSNPIGAGPFEFDNWDQGSSVDVTSFGDYHRDSPSVDLNWATISEPNAQYNYFNNQNADLAGVPTSLYDPSKVSEEDTDSLGRITGTYGPLDNGETVNWAKITEVGTYYIGFNMEQVPKAVRQAMAYVVTQPEFVTQAYKDRLPAAYHLTPPQIYPGGTEQYNSDTQDWPYGLNENNIDQARQVMEDAGYSEDEPYELQWTQYTSGAWQQIGQLIRDRLDAAHIDMSLEQADFSSLLSRSRNGDLEAYTLGWVADYPAPDNFLQLIDPPNTNFRNTAASGARVFWTEDSYTDSENRQAAVEAFDRVQNNSAPSADAQEIRNDAYLELESILYDEVPLIPIFHSATEPMWYDYVDYNIYGGMGQSRQKFDDVSVDKDDSSTLNMINAPVSTLDPIQSSGTASGEVIQQVFDSLTNYPDGRTSVEPLLIEDFELSDDFTTYTFTLKNGTSFHNGDEVYAEDVVYSWRRLAESDNSVRSGFLLDFLGVEAEYE